MNLQTFLSTSIPRAAADLESALLRLPADKREPTSAIRARALRRVTRSIGAPKLRYSTATPPTDEKLNSTLRFVSPSNPTPRELPFWSAMMHLFNHQAHHRGQITALMEQASLDCGVTDLAAMANA